MNIQDINTFTRFLCSATSTDYGDAILLINTNNAYEKVIGKLINVNGDFQFDDSNYTDLPIGIGNLVSGQQSYSFDASLLDLIGISAKDSSGNFQALTPIDQRDMGSTIGNSSGSLNRTGKVDPSQFENVSGMPIYYDKSGNTAFLYPTPITGSVTTTGGLKIFFQRTASVFTSAEVTTGTKVPGFMSTYHEILSYMSAIPYCIQYKPDRVVSYQNEILRIEKEMLARYARRSKDEVRRIQVKQESCR
ncbi:MAG: hypothetical protein WC724_03795 [Candidatus Paceibacterota bacterium]|jgi:hypothetical protein